MLYNHLIGKQVKVIFNDHWPAASGRYEMEGADDDGVWVRRPDGWQRYINYAHIKDIELAVDE